MLCLCPQEVNEMWSGLGYYSRGRRLLEGATKVHCSGIQLYTVYLFLRHLCIGESPLNDGDVEEANSMA